MIRSTKKISIHALRVESDTPLISMQVPRTISIHALRVESDEKFVNNTDSDMNFNPRPPCGERHLILSDFVNNMEISIHALRVESDPQYKETKF